MQGRDISKWEIMYISFLTKISDIKRFFKRFSKKSRDEFAYEKMRLDQIREMILNYKDDE